MKVHSMSITLFAAFVEAVKQQVLPPGRGMHTANTLSQLRQLMPADATLADLVMGWQILSQAQPNEDPATAQRRATCGELASIATRFTSGQQGNLSQSCKIWQSWVDAFKTSSDPRQAGMAKTFVRELAELQKVSP
jgi:hypothetical protein